MLALTGMEILKPWNFRYREEGEELFDDVGKKDENEESTRECVIEMDEQNDKKREDK